jgi:hypothetical protein
MSLDSSRIFYKPENDVSDETLDALSDFRKRIPEQETKTRLIRVSRRVQLLGNAVGFNAVTQILVPDLILKTTLLVLAIPKTDSLAVTEFAGYKFIYTCDYLDEL